MGDGVGLDDQDRDRAREHERARLRGPKRLLGYGSLGALLVSVLSGLAGVDGEGGLALFLLGLAVVLSGAGLWLGVGLLVDDRRDVPRSPRRAWLSVGLFVAALLCMTALGGLGEAAGGGQ